MGNRLWVFALLASLLLGASAYVCTDTWYVGVIVAALAVVCSFAYAIPCVRIYLESSRKRHECYLFIHGYLVTLSVSTSLDKAFEAGEAPLGKEYHVLDATLATMEAKEKTEYLQNYFESDLYRMFLSILRLYLDRGGDVLKLSGELTAEASRIEETEQVYRKSAARKGASFFFLWLLSLTILVFLRFGLQSFFETLRNSPAYLTSVGAFYLFFLVSCLLYVRAHTGSRPYVKRKEAKADVAS